MATAEADLAYSGYRLMDVLVFAGGIPLSMTALITGVWLGLGTHWGLVRHSWVFAKLLLLIDVTLFGMLLFQPAESAAASRDGSMPDGQWRPTAVVASQLLMLVTATALSVFKPGGRIGRRPRRTAADRV